MLRCGLLGRTLNHSFSPAIHGMIGAYEYKLYPLEPNALEDFVRNTDLDGLNVTIPYKKEVAGLCRELSPRAAAIGSVNTMLRLPDGGWLGDNTDFDGFMHMLGPDAGAFSGRKALVLGSGGASNTVCAALKSLQIPNVVISRTGQNNYENLSRHKDAQMIVNTTPVGTYPGNGQSPVDLREFPCCRLVLDLIYNPARTALLLQAEELCIPGRNGLCMLAAQAVRAGELFLGHSLPEELTDVICASISSRMRNIVLIGMPGCGKTTVARHLERLTGRQMIDTDRMIIDRAGMSIPEIFAKFGEGYFRKLETEVLEEVSKLSGKIIAAGGGVVTIPQNRSLIRQNSICVLLECDQSRLQVSGRPLSESVGTEQLLAERLPLYLAWSDITIRNEDPQDTAAKIKGALELENFSN